MALPRRISSLLLFVGIVLLCTLALSLHALPSPDQVKARMGALARKQPVTTNDEVQNCTDPYRQPGYLYQPKSYKQSAWIPYTQELYDLADPESAAYPTDGPGPVFNKSTPEVAILDAAPPSHMATLLNELALARSKESASATASSPSPNSDSASAAASSPSPNSWLRNRRILVIGDSVDRFMLQFLCEETKHKLHEPARHTTATCHIPELNFTATHWHFPGTYTTRPSWWWMPKMKFVAFEERWANLWRPTMPQTNGMEGGRPDLILWQANLWDQRVMWEVGKAKEGGEEIGLGKHTRQIVWDELRFVMSRMKKFVSAIDAEFGTGIPIMYRTHSLHRASAGNDASLYELDRISRFIAAQHGHEVFEWGRLIAAQEHLYMDKTHLKKGAASWLYMNMALGYLKRGLDDGWAECHEESLGWGGR